MSGLDAQPQHPIPPRYPHCAYPAETECNMALADIEATLTGVVPWRTCAVCHHLSERDAAWGERLRRLLANRGVKFRDLAKELATDDAEPDIPEDALSRHARGLCAAKETLR